jgi:hypothetical protein
MKPDVAYIKIKKLLHLRYPPPEFIVWEELTITEGANYRRADFFVMSQWRSQNYKRIAFEIKLFHSDFVNELKDPRKREPAMKYSHEFYYVAPLNVIPVAELPEGCGLIELNATSLRVKRRAM